jgi:ATP-dependent DNA ligase
MLPNLIRPMLAVAVQEPFDSDHYLFEIKWDGIRCLAFVENGRVRLQSRELIDITAQFPELGCLAQVPDGTVLDGERVAMEGNRPCLGKIQGRALLQDKHRIELMSQSSPAVYVVFDLIYRDGRLWPSRFGRRRELSSFSGLRAIGSSLSGGAWAVETCSRPWSWA